MKEIIFNIAFLIIGAIIGWIAAVQMFNAGVRATKERLMEAAQRLDEITKKIKK